MYSNCHILSHFLRKNLELLGMDLNMVHCVRENKNTTFFAGDSIIKIFLKHLGKGNFCVRSKFCKNVQILTEVWIRFVFIPAASHQ